MNLFAIEISLKTVVILEMRMLLCLSEWTKYSPQACVEVGKAGIIHLLNAIVGGIRQSFQLSEVNCWKSTVTVVLNIPLIFFLKL